MISTFFDIFRYSEIRLANLPAKTCVDKLRLWVYALKQARRVNFWAKECWSWDKEKQHNLFTRTITAISDNGLYLMDTSQSGLYPWWPWVFHLQLTATWTNSSMWLFLSREKSKRPVTWMRKSSGWPFLASEFCSASASVSRRWLALTITRSQGQKPACKHLGRNGQERAITIKAAYTPTSNRAGSVSYTHLTLPTICSV